MSQDKKTIPELKELHYAPEVAFKNDNLKHLLSFPPHDGWIKKNKFAQNAEYLPIDKVEFLLDRIFQEWKVEVLKTGQLLNAVEVTIRLHYKNPITGDWMFHDGVAAKELQTSAGSGILKSDLSNISPGAIQMALPIAKSIAIRDAADHLGRLFGRDLNRKDTIEAFSGSYGKGTESHEKGAETEKENATSGSATTSYALQNIDL